MASDRSVRVFGRTAIPGGAIAFAMSYALNKSIILATIHMIFGWLYVLYWLFSYTDISNWINSWIVY